MQGIGKQQETIHQIGFGGAKHRGLSPAVGMATQEDALRNKLAHRGYGVSQSFAVAASVSRPRRTMGARLAVGKIAAQHCESRRREGFRKRDEQGPLCV